MVTVINSSADINSILRYNENKVSKNVAECLLAEGYPRDADELSFEGKLNRLTNQAALRPTVRRPGVHISINFDPTERIGREKLLRIAADYMDGIGFGDHPYLVYEHHDSGHQHIHIVTLNIGSDGMPLDTSNIGRRRSEPTRKALEKKYGLVVAQEADRKKAFEISPVNITEVLYGKVSTRSAIMRVLNGVVGKYNYTSLAELNALLKLYNVVADRGTEDSRVFRNGGLLYHVIDAGGNKVGKPIKASRIFGTPSPTLAVLQGHFADNEKARTTSRSPRTQLRNTLDLLLLDSRNDRLDRLLASLREQGVDSVVRSNAEGRAFGITFIDHRTRHVFKGSDVGYSLATITKRLTAFATQTDKRSSRPSLDWPNPPLNWTVPAMHDDTSPPVAFALLETLTQPEYVDPSLPWYLRIGTRKKRRGRRARTRN